MIVFAALHNTDIIRNKNGSADITRIPRPRDAEFTQIDSYSQSFLGIRKILINLIKI